MEIKDAINLIHAAPIQQTGAQKWIDLGCGSGTFTSALADLLPSHSEIVGVDLESQKLPTFINDIDVKFIQSDIQEVQNLPNELDGVLMANSLHYIQNQKDFLSQIDQLFKDKSRFIIVEYDISIGNPWIPFPVSRSEITNLFAGRENNLIDLGRVSSQYGDKEMYAIWLEY